MSEFFNRQERNAYLVDFTNEDSYGKYLDLHECFKKYINLKGIEEVDYITYLSTFDFLFDTPKHKKNAAYRRYVEALLEYLMEFLGRVKPLLDINKELTEANKDFEEQCETNSFPGWPKEVSSALANIGAHLDLSAFSSWEELTSLGLDRLKSTLMALGLKCGGTLEERAQRLFSTKNKSSLNLNLLPKKQKKLKGKNVKRQKKIACLEAQV